MAAALRSAVAACAADATPIILGSEFLFSELEQLGSSERKWCALKPSDQKLGLFTTLNELSAKCIVVPGTVVSRHNSRPVNYAPVLWGGTEIKRIWKAGVGGTTEWTWHKPPAPPGLGYADTLTIEYGNHYETRIGVEICTDIGTMQAALAGASFGQWPEIYMMPSAGMSNSDILYLRKGGTLRGNRASYFQFTPPNSFRWLERGYSFTPGPGSHLRMFAMLERKPTLFMQADGMRACVGMKAGFRTEVELLVPLESTPVGATTQRVNQEDVFTTVVHRFPVVELLDLQIRARA
jgi:hypothetical protein